MDFELGLNAISLFIVLVLVYFDSCIFKIFMCLFTFLILIQFSHYIFKLFILILELSQRDHLILNEIKTKIITF